MTRKLQLALLSIVLVVLISAIAAAEAIHEKRHVGNNLSTRRLVKRKPSASVVRMTGGRAAQQLRRFGKATETAPSKEPQVEGTGKAEAQRNAYWTNKSVLGSDETKPGSLPLYKPTAEQRSAYIPNNHAL
ncbi:hypothetical protein PTTG_25166 [Puccinia triticina 1-1 BBBD Race 1]|uniref:RxLR effector protein n=2 Tax=Puccinia triticina TaxID=208348 RepID=A0A180H6E2_PUCT1|nr:uncharacterized protein PtA15_9A157 [Puccinia triticina]OAW00110.1 hypothetical protein PTTG_25166 [Puccinia triticina 1-1 BBBD Race 1]WAQ88032.1 hypothetical protein PtA15_9A157 [Puccinia triticina]WAR60228.1 hypothetical protein PtB15_9B165 [Puccinia triticina]